MALFNAYNILLFLLAGNPLNVTFNQLNHGLLRGILF